MYPGRYFNPRTPRGVRQREGALCRWRWGFQSTHPARGATPGWCAALPSYHYFNPRTPRGVRRSYCLYLLDGIIFQSTHPARGATVHHPEAVLVGQISIHAPREGCDSSRFSLTPACFNFNPRTPRGVRPVGLPDIVSSPVRFQSTHPARGATGRPCKGPGRGSISIHAPREGCDVMHGLQHFGAVIFISIHAPREGCDLNISINYGTYHILFQSTHPARGATTKRNINRRYTILFQSTHPARGATANFTKEQRVCLAQFAYLHKGKKAEHTKTNAPMLH